MPKSLVILGRQPALGRAELESLLGADAVKPLGKSAALLESHHSKIPFSRLGGSLKLAKLLHEFDTTDWKKIEAYLLENLPKHLQYTTEGKLNIGLSVFGLKVSTNQLLATGLTIKKTLKSHGKSVRLVSNKAPTLNSAQVRSNKLFTANGWELVFVQNDSKVIMGLTTQEQDIDAYAARDHGRPKRDAQVGMLPPKLAQIIINLAAANTANTSATILDPFCGTGVILQEARLMGYNVLGSDIDKRMIDFSNENMNWLSRTFQPSGERYDLAVADALQYEWPTTFHTVAAETFLGQPFASEPAPTTLQETMKNAAYLHQKFLANLARQTAPGFRLCIAVPAWFTKSGLQHLKTLDSLEELGYNRLKFKYAADRDLIYHREGQIVGRELVVLKRK